MHVGRHTPDYRHQERPQKQAEQRAARAAYLALTGEGPVLTPAPPTDTTRPGSAGSAPEEDPDA